MDTSVDPCVDFFAYSCGTWIRKNPIPPDQTSWSIYSKLQDDNKAILREILESAALAKVAPGSVTQKIGDYYAACMDETAINAARLKPLQPALDRIQEMHSKQDIAAVAVALVPDGALFRFRSDQDYKDSTREIAEADQGGLGLPDRDYYVKTDAKSVELRAAYVAHLQKMFELLGDKSEAAAAEAQTVLRIETALAKGSLTAVERRDPQKLYHKMTAQQLGALSPSFEWKAYFAKVGLPSVESLNVETPEFFRTLNTELKKEKLANWKVYLRWHLVNGNAPFLSSDFVNADFDFYGKTLTGAQELEPRWKRCVGYVDNDLGEALGQAYVERTFSPEAKQRAQKMVKEIEDAMGRDIDSLPWMTSTTKQHALEKLHAVAKKIRYPDN
jgi:endothelin-converting enzyme/putative endopeptidase